MLRKALGRRHVLKVLAHVAAITLGCAVVLVAVVLVALVPRELAATASPTQVFIEAGDAARLLQLDRATLIRTDSSAQPADTPVGLRVRWTDLTAAPGSGRLADADAVRARLEASGVDPNATLLVAGDWLDGWGEEGHAWWALTWAGAARVHLVIGGLPALVAALDGGRGAVPETGTAGQRDGSGRPRRAAIGAWGPGRPELLARPDDARVEAPEGALATRESQPRGPTPRGDARWAWPRWARWTRALSSRAGSGGVAVLDVRSADEFRGATPFGERRGGHIPGAAHVPWQQLVVAATGPEPETAIRGLLTAAGVPEGAPVVAYCTDGVRSAMAVAALTAAGVIAANHDGSFREWAADPSRPVERPPVEPPPVEPPPVEPPPVER